MNYYETLEDIYDLVNSLNDETLTKLQRNTLEILLKQKVKILCKK